MSRNKLLLTIVLLGLFSIALAKTPIEAEKEESRIPIFQATEYQRELAPIDAPFPAWDSNRIFPGATANLTREVAVGQYFKGALDDTVRIVSVQSGGTRFLVIATDTLPIPATYYGKNKYRIETPLTYPSGATAHAVAVGDVDGDQFTDILYGTTVTTFRLYWVEWEPTLPAWVYRDSISVNAAINDIVFGDGDNDPTTRDFYFNIAQTSPSSAIMRARWDGAVWDTTRILLAGTVTTRGITIGEVRADVPGNEVYVTGGGSVWMLNCQAGIWTTSLLLSGLVTSTDIVIGDINPNFAGPELIVGHSSTSYQISVWSWFGGTWNVFAWNLTGTAADVELAFGDVLSENPGREVVMVQASTTVVPRVFWYAPHGGGAFGYSLPKVVSGQSDFGVAISPLINRFRAFNNEIVLSGGGSLVEVEQRDFVNDVGTYYFFTANPTAVQGAADFVNVAVFNAGSAPQTVNVNYLCRFNPSNTNTVSIPLNEGEHALVQIPATFTFLGLDTLVVFTNLAGDGNLLNDTTKVAFNVYPAGTMVGCGFNQTLFPPSRNSSFYPFVPGDSEWIRTALVGTVQWTRVTSSTNPTATPLEGGGMAWYNSYSSASGNQARLRTHRFNIGPAPRKVMVNFNMYRDPAYMTNPDSVLVEISTDGITYERKAGFHRYHATAAWYPMSVEMGDFPGNANLYVAFRAYSGYGNNMLIDAVTVTLADPTSPVNDVGVDLINLPSPMFTGNQYPVQVRIRNFGLGDQTGVPIPVSYDPGDGQPIVTEVYNGPLGPLQTVLYTFTALLQPPLSGEFIMSAYTTLAGDENPANDQTSRAYRVCPTINYAPFLKDFNEAWTNSTNPPFCGWSIVDGGSQTPPVTDNNDWHRFVVATPARTVARVNYSPAENHNDWLISPRFSFGPGAYTLKYWHWYNDFSTALLDTGKVLVSINGGTDWIEITRYSNADDSGYKSHDISEIVANQNNVRFAFQYCAYDEFWWYIDDFEIAELVDVATTAITAPALTEIKRVQFTPQVTVTNNSNQAFDIPVSAEIWGAGAPAPITVGTGTTTDRYPFERFYNYATHEAIYLASEINAAAAGNITHLAYYRQDGINTDLITPVDIYMMHTSATTLASGTITLPPTAPYQLVYSGAFPNDAGEGWREIALTAPFNYNGTDNLQILIVKGYQDYISSTDAPIWRYTATAVNRTRRAAADASQPTYLTATTFRPNIRITGLAPLVIVYNPPGIIVPAVPGLGGVGEAYFEPVALNIEGNYLFKARTMLVGDQNPANNEMTRDFTVFLPLPVTLQYPPDGEPIADNTPTFTWDPVDGVTVYQIQVDDENTFAAPVVFMNLVAGANSYTPGDALNDGTYYWRVRAEAPGTPDPWSEIYTFSIDTEGPVAPVLVSPSGTITDLTPTFDWEPVADAAEYNLVVTSIADEEVINIMTSETEYTPDEPLADNSDYTWTVRAKDALENWGVFAEPLEFTIDVPVPAAPELLYPEDHTSASTTPTFEWGEVEYGVLYNLVVWNADAEEVINIETDELTYTVIDPLDVATYTWSVKAKNEANEWGNFAEPFTFTVDNVPPEVPTIIAPTANYNYTTETQTFEWTEIADAVLYELSVEPLKATYQTANTTYDLMLGTGSYTCKVRARDYATNWSDWSAEVNFSVSLPHWVQVEDVPQAADIKVGKFVKDGGSMVTVGNSIYLFPGNKSWQFYKYTPGATPAYTTLCTIPYGYKPLTTPPAINKKKIGKGAALCYDGVNTIYATKGNGTREFWAYRIADEVLPETTLPGNTWQAKAFVPVPKALKGGTSLTFKDGLVYLLAGGQKATEQNFFVYDPTADTALGTPWTTLTNATLTDGKVYKDGSCLTNLGGTIYALKSSKMNHLMTFDGTAWTLKDSIPLTHNQTGTKKSSVKDGAAMTTDGEVIYAIKGGGSPQFWMYTPGVTGVWAPLQIVPMGLENKGPKTGAAIAYLNEKVFLMKGNNLKVMWRYNTLAKGDMIASTANTTTSVMTANTTTPSIITLDVTPNPFTRMATVRYTVPVTGKVSVKLYSATGRLTETLLDGTMNAGTYTMTLSADKLAKGIYFLKFNNETHTSEVKLLLQ